MKKFIVEGREYTVTECTAIALCDLEAGTRTRQNALHVVSYSDGGERFDYVVFGWEMSWLESEEDFLQMSEDSSAWESHYTVIDTIEE